jgi:hypothetical protein
MAMVKTVELTSYELRICAWVGKKRYEAAVEAHRNAGQGPSRDDHSPANHIRGAECEFSASILLNLYWRPTIGFIKSKDVGGLIEVRSTVLSYGRLIVKPDGDGPFVLVIKENDSTFHWGGWMHAEAAKKFPLTTDKGDPAHFVPQRYLSDMPSLLGWIRSRPVQAAGSPHASNVLSL